MSAPSIVDLAARARARAERQRERALKNRRLRCHTSCCLLLACGLFDQVLRGSLDLGVGCIDRTRMGGLALSKEGRVHPTCVHTLQKKQKQTKPQRALTSTHAQTQTLQFHLTSRSSHHSPLFNPPTACKPLRHDADSHLLLRSRACCGAPQHHRRPDPPADAQAGGSSKRQLEPAGPW